MIRIPTIMSSIAMVTGPDTARFAYNDVSQAKTINAIPVKTSPRTFLRRPFIEYRSAAVTKSDTPAAAKNRTPLQINASGGLGMYLTFTMFSPHAWKFVKMFGFARKTTPTMIRKNAKESAPGKLGSRSRVPKHSSCDQGGGGGGIGAGGGAGGATIGAAQNAQNFASGLLSAPHLPQAGTTTTPGRHEVGPSLGLSNY